MILFAARFFVAIINSVRLTSLPLDDSNIILVENELYNKLVSLFVLKLLGILLFYLFKIFEFLCFEYRLISRLILKEKFLVRQKIIKRIITHANVRLIGERN